MQRYSFLAKLAEELCWADSRKEQYEIEEDILDLVLEDRKIPTAQAALGPIEEEKKEDVQKDKVNDKDAEDLKEHLAKLGEFRGKFDINAEQDSFTKV